MKILNIIPLIVALAIFQSCNPLETELETFDVPNEFSADLNITLVEDDYEFVEFNFPNFGSEDDAKTFIPQILTNNYPQLGNGSSALVHYDIYDPIRINEELEFELDDDDYEALEQDFGTLSSQGDIFDATEYKHPNPENNDVVTLTYEWFCFGCPDEGTLTSKLTYYEGKWYNAYVPTGEDYTFMGQSFPNFESRTEARERIAKVLGLKYLFDDEGTIRTAVFTYTYKDDEDVRQFDDFMAVFQFDGADWQPFQDVVQKSLQLGHDGNVWVPDNTIKYSLTGADYDAIAAAAASTNPDGSNSMANFGNVDVSLWPDADILTFVGARLLELFPAVEGQKYLVSYATWEPGAGTRTIHLIYNGSAYELVQ